VSIVTVPDDDMSSALKAVLTERKQPASDAEGLAVAVEAALIEGVEPVNPPPAALPGLLAQVRATDRITHFAPQLAELYDLSLEQAQALITQLRGSEGWTEGPAAGVKLFPVQTGPRVRDALAALVSLEPGSEFPSHPHLGPEKVLVLEGAYRDSSGEEYWRGELHQSAAGTQHSFRAMGGIPCICAGLNAISDGL
jgi:anti-sigma factor ChrR (cupin superfamily)